MSGVEDEDDEALTVATSVFRLLKDIRDPERPENLHQLGVICQRDISVKRSENRFDVHVEFTPTVRHCHLATLIGLCIRTKLRRDLPFRHKLLIALKRGSHSTEKDVNKQINDKERVAAALENESLRKLVHECISHS